MEMKAFTFKVELPVAAWFSVCGVRDEEGEANWPHSNMGLTH